MAPWLSRLWYDANYCTTMAAYTALWSLRFEGGRHVPRTGPALLLANHESFLDPVAIGLAASSRRLYFLARKTLFVGLFGDFLRSVNVVPVDQEGVAKEGLKTTLAKLHEGHAVLVFPEGARSPDGKMHPLKPGVHLLLKRAAGVPVIPVGVAGMYEAYPLHAKLPRFAPLILPVARRGPVAVSIAAPLPSERFQDMPREQVLRELFDAIAAAKRRAEVLKRKPA